MALPFHITPAAIINNTILGINLLTGTLNADVVAVLDQGDFKQIFRTARPMRAVIHETARVMEHPLESGAMIADHRVIDPRRIELQMIVAAQDFSSAFQQIRSAWLNGTLLTVQTKAAVYQNMVIQALPREESPDRFDITTISIQLREIIFALPNAVSSTTSVKYYEPLSPYNRTSVLRGLQSAVVNPAATLLSIINAASVWGIRR